MNIEKINAQLEEYLNTQEVVGAALVVRQNDEILMKDFWGNLAIDGTHTVEEDTIFRLASMTKPITAVAVMQLVEQGRINLDDDLTQYIPEFHNLRVVADERYEFNDRNMKRIPVRLLTFNPKRIATVAADRMITVRDLLSHSSGLEQGIAGLIMMTRMKYKDDTLETRAYKYTSHPLDFQPGTAASYSPLAGFDILARLVEITSGKSFEEYLYDNLFAPLGMKSTTFHPTKEQKHRIPRLYRYGKGKLKDVTDSKKDIHGIGRIGSKYLSGSAGLYASLGDYDRFVRMLANEGELNGVRILESEIVQQMHTEGAYEHLEFNPGMSWGLGMIIRQNPEIAQIPATKGTYGWSGAFGTHFFISPADNLSVVFMMNREDIGGADSYISKKVEELVFEK